MPIEMLAAGDAGDALVRLVDKETFIPVMAIFMGCLIAIISIITSAVRRIAETKARERTRSEVAAYIAEGSMTAEEGERLLNAGPKESSGSCCD